MSAMTAGLQLPFRPDGWTVDDLDALPDDARYVYELVDGALLVSPPPPNRHNVVANRLDRLLAAVLPAGWESVAPGALELDVRNWRAPDLVVVDRAGLTRRYAAPTDTLLAVEVMSPSSISTDRLVKPEQYARAGIPHFWRIELQPAVLVTHVLDGRVYRETARFTDDIALDDPVRIRFRLDDLLG
jgi:Uma2 family endonuclease